MEAALHAGTAQALAGAISATSAWLTAHGTSKLWMAANNAVRTRHGSLTAAGPDIFNLDSNARTLQRAAEY